MIKYDRIGNHATEGDYPMTGWLANNITTIELWGTLLVVLLRLVLEAAVPFIGIRADLPQAPAVRNGELKRPPASHRRAGGHIDPSSPIPLARIASTTTKTHPRETVHSLAVHQR
ncbi:hypothetical protein ACQPYV_12790 [Micromonospora saelicesensis]|uniref:hypothetical protein n=1 Tax=Micromonospora saelicesensis TaxID=285676 RepID=UPI003D8FA6F3